MNTPFRDNPDYVRERRAVIREHHPDRGGSDEALIKALRELDRKWEAKTSVEGYVDRTRMAFETVRPDFIPEEMADMAFHTAGRYAERAQNTAQNLRAKSEVFAQSTFSQRVKKNANKFYSTASNTVRSKLPRKFPGAKRFTFTDGPKKDKQ